mmetsp:Transcript_11039/g.26680  ORF Transcript_11039/g.26680 Transcript_11039/m.26680 type:complete len:444 (-) Transcript_11039:359-1690(-)
MHLRRGVVLLLALRNCFADDPVDFGSANPPLVRREAKTPESDLEERLANAMEVAKVAEAAAARAAVMVAAQDQRLNAADEKIIELEQENAEQKKELEVVRGDFAKVDADVIDALNQTNSTAERLQAEVEGIQREDGQLKAKDDILERVVKDVESKVIEFGTEAMHAETAAGHAQKDAGKAKNASDLLKAREANLKYEVDDLGTTLDEVLKDQNSSKSAVQKLLNRTQNLGKTMLKISKHSRKFDGSLSKAVRQTGESDKLAKMAKEEADDALDDVESVGQPVPGFGGGYSRASSVVGEEGPRGPPGPPGPPGPDVRSKKSCTVVAQCTWTTKQAKPKWTKRGGSACPNGCFKRLRSNNSSCSCQAACKSCLGSCQTNTGPKLQNATNLRGGLHDWRFDSDNERSPRSARRTWRSRSSRSKGQTRSSWRSASRTTAFTAAQKQL